MRSETNRFAKMNIPLEEPEFVRLVPFVSKINSFRTRFRLPGMAVDQEVIQPTDEEQTIVGWEGRGLDSGPLKFQKTPMSNAVRATRKRGNETSGLQNKR
ncbi:hypothetical protein AVEN_16691-1 [Araneus ventricosus]|uniref:Uncharacterized protein n=1 Tax=Araneus ventricosus TaxID=182803 RepID=A0A4Y2Q4P8_ARAVE|nr:hypothetical protein AVEN_3780-1 [Araneus ventricosus]GBN58539.1 hypothetical protein AVEN_140619-1 [Araneus ventricosus]GBN58892.1 hypothetical protein AVEN_163074-1 [Araneus ventricosus]GBN59019.1 hypothetical protein AVEN_16691-1 [Araneus ventricosus]